MDLEADARPSESPLIEGIWNSRSQQPGEFISIAVSASELVITKHKGVLQISLRGPETKASIANGPDDAEFFGIVFKLGTYMPHLPASSLVDSPVELPQAGSNSFWLHGSAWEIPNLENADTFIERLTREGLLVHEPIVDSVLEGSTSTLSLRSAQRRFLRATGLTYNTVRQIERARMATTLLRAGTPILDTVFEAGYFDQPHLTHSLRRYIGLTPAQIIDEGRQERLSFLYNTESPD